MIASGGAAARSGSMIGSRGTPSLAVNNTPFTRMSRWLQIDALRRRVKIVVCEVDR